MPNYAPYSVLLPVYFGDGPLQFAESLLSITGQTLPPSEILVIRDGPVPEGIESILLNYEETGACGFRVIRLEKNVGLGQALRIGVEQCQNELVARMDADDISVPDRCRIQTEKMANDPSLVIVGGQIAEFEASSEVTGIRKVPLCDNDIRSFINMRNPFNHMTVMFRRSAVLMAGNYAHMPLFEDYWLWVRLIALGKAENLPEVLVYARTGENMLKRRAGFGYVAKTLRFQRERLREGYISKMTYIINCTIRTAAALIPAGARKILYRAALRKKTEG